jgi:hypothetical protein
MITAEFGALYAKAGTLLLKKLKLEQLCMWVCFGAQSRAVLKLIWICFGDQSGAALKLNLEMLWRCFEAESGSTLDVNLELL